MACRSGTWRPNARSTAGAVATGLAFWLWSSSAAATGIPSIYDNYQSYLIGGRAAGMGGAYTALSCDEAALHYNPAALACAKASRIELAANAYRLQSLNIPDAFGDGQDVSALNFQSLPAVAGFARVLLDGAPDRSGRLVLGFAVEIPHSLALKGDPAEPDEPNYLSFAAYDQLTAADVGIAYQLHEMFAAGLSFGGGLRTAEARFGQLLVSRQQVPCGPLDSLTCFEFYTADVEQELWSIGLRGKLGVRVTPTQALSFGLAVVSPTIDLAGSTKLSETHAGALLAVDGAGNLGHVYSPYPLRASGSSDLALPFRLAVGGAYSTEAFTFALDASLNFPHTVAAAYDLEAEDIDGFVAPTDDELETVEQKLTYTWQPNVNVGVEFAVTEGVVIDVGAFTDLSSVSEQSVKDYNLDRVHLFGGSLALGVMDEQIRSFFGVSFEYGMATVKVMRGDLNLDAVWAAGGDLDMDANSTLTKWNLVGFIGSSYSFFSKPDEDEAPPEAGKPPPAPAEPPATKAR